MADIQNTIYQDEPISIDLTQKDIYTPPQYLAMRKIAKSGGAFYKPEAQVFYEQGKFMEDFEDDYDYRGDFMRYFPTYQFMNDSQLRGYFSWRAQVRRGVIKRAPLSFVFVYIYELLNLIGVRAPEDGFHRLKNFWTAYRDTDSQIDRYVKLWLKDYVVYYNLDRSLLEELPGAGFNNAVLTLFNYKTNNAEDVFSALNSLSSYDFEKSRFFKKHPGDARNVTYGVFAALSEHCEQNRKNSLCEKLFGKVYASSYSMFKSAVFYDLLRPKDFVYKINDLCTYTCKNGNWTCEMFFCYKGKNRQIGELLKAIDFIMRQKYNFKSSLKAAEPGKTLRAIICKVIDNYLETIREAARPKIEIDVSKLQGIRDTALETQKKLLVEEAGEIEEPGAEILYEKTAPENRTGLNDTEYLFLKCLLYGQPYDGLLRGLPLSVLVDAVNESLFDRFGDTVISDAGGRPELLPDYIEELKGIISA